jgi:hypothetical protein
VVKLKGKTGVDLPEFQVEISPGDFSFADLGGLLKITA